MKLLLPGIVLINGKPIAVGYRVAVRERGSLSMGGFYGFSAQLSTSPLSAADAAIVMPVLERVSVVEKKRKVRK